MNLFDLVGENTQFKDVKFMSAKEKEEVLKDFKKLVAGGDMSNLTKRLYNHLHLHCGFIAHYDIHGFKHEYNAPSDFVRFLEWLLEDRCHNDYRDINDEMKALAKAALPTARKVSFHQNRKTELDVLFTLAQKHNYKLIKEDTVC